MKQTKRILAFLLAVTLTLLAALFTGCAVETQESRPGTTYCSAPGRYGDIDVFSITLFKDGSFYYSASPLSSYIGMGTWTREGDVITLRDGVPDTRFHEDGSASDSGSFVNCFRVDGDALVFIEDGSTNFSYRKLADGERLTQIN